MPITASRSSRRANACPGVYGLSRTLRATLTARPATVANTHFPHSFLGHGYRFKTVVFMTTRTITPRMVGRSKLNGCMVDSLRLDRLTYRRCRRQRSYTQALPSPIDQDVPADFRYACRMLSMALTTVAFFLAACFINVGLTIGTSPGA